MTPAPEEFNAKVRRIAHMRSYGKPLSVICHDTNTRGDDRRLLVAAADLYLSYVPFDPIERTEPLPVSGEFDGK